MDLVVAHHSDYIERSLNLNRQAVLYQFSDIRIEILTRLTKFHAKLLDCKSEQRCAASR
jgi:hypothetical protein